MTDWIKHVPGDPMPVDGDTVVAVKNYYGDVVEEPRAARTIDWGKRYGCTAYRIHKPEQQKEREMKYKAGDRVTIVLDDEDVAEFNQGCSVYAEIKIRPQQIIAHEPAPEPVVGYVDYDPHEPNGLKYVAALETDRMLHGQTRIRITYSPATKEVKAEVVE